MRRVRAKRVCAKRRRAAAGFTLLELLVAVALLAVLAVLSWRAMDSVLRARDRIVSASDELRSLSITLSQMEEDIRRSWPIRLLGLPQPPIVFLVSANDRPDAGDRPEATLMLLRETNPADAMQVQRVLYRFAGGRFERGFAPWSAPSPDGAQPVAESPLTWQPLLEGFDEVRFRAWVTGRGWMPASALAQGSLQGTVAGIELTLVRGGQRIVRVFPVSN